MSLARAAFANAGWLMFGRILGESATFLLLVLIARLHGNQALGAYAFAMALSSFYVIAAECGIYDMFIRESGRFRPRLLAYFGRIISLGTVLTALSLLALGLTAVILPFSDPTRALLIILGIYQLLYKLTEGCTMFFMVIRQLHLMAALEVISKVTALLLAAVLLLAGASLPTAVAALAVVALAQLIAARWLIATRVGRMPWCFAPRELLALLRQAGKYAATGFQLPIYSRADVMTLGLLAGAAAVGIYNAAFRIVVLLNVLAGLAAVALLPVIAGLYEVARDEFVAYYQTALRLTLLITVPAAVGLGLIAPALVRLIFGAEFAESALVLRYLCGLVVLAPARSIVSTFLTAADRQSERAKIEWAGAAVVWAACLLLVPAAGGAGAALAVVLAEAAMAGLMLLRLAPVCGRPEVGSRLAISLLGSAAFALPALVWPQLPLPLVVILSMVIYLVVLALFADIRRTEYRLLRAAMARPGEPAPLLPPRPAGRS